MGLAPKLGDVGVITIFCAESFCLAATLRYSVTGAWLQGHSVPLEYFLDTAMRDEWQWIVFPIPYRSHDTFLLVENHSS